MKRAVRKPRVMVVDDDPDCLQVVVAALKEYEVLPLSEGEGLAFRAQEFSPDVLILDVQLRETDGFSLCRDLKGRRATSSIPVIFLSGLAGDEDFLNAFGAGGSVYLTKPLDPGDLRRTIETLLRERAPKGSDPV